MQSSSYLMAQQPHIILIVSDQHRGDALNCMGNPSVITPNLDALAQDGTLFTNGYSSAPSSTPARSGLLTGLSPWHHGMLGYGRVGSQYRYEMPQMLRDLNYFTFGSRENAPGSRKKHYMDSMVHSSMKAAA